MWGRKGQKHLKKVREGLKDDIYHMNVYMPLTAYHNLINLLVEIIIFIDRLMY
jgi:hypothetical protein